MTRTLRMLAASAFLIGITHMPASMSAQQDDQLRRSNAAATRTNDIYIVQMLDRPVVSYDGGVDGLRPTKPNRGRKIDPEDGDVRAYASYLNGRHNQAIGAVGGGRKVYDYQYTYNGFAAELSESQAEALRNVSGVLSVTKDELQFGTTSSTPQFLGLTAPGGLWEQLGGVGSAGEDVIIGVVDSGIWPESPSFSDRTGTNGNGSQGGKLSYHHMPNWHGKCTNGEAFNHSDCNQKLIGARYYNAAWGGSAALEAARPWEFMSPRDYNGHGSHTASTAGGNSGVVAPGAAAVFGPMSGMAPRARISVYKALWSTEDGSTASGFSSDLVAAIDQAVADGVDVINYSIAGTNTNFLDAVEVAFLFAADAGVFVAAAAGNSGPNTGTVIHPSPWITTVAAGTHSRNGEGSVTLGNGTTYTGASLATAVGPAPLIDSTAAGLPGADPTALALCFTASDNMGTAVLDPAKVAGKIVVCDRGVNARVNKSLAVRDAGGVGMILVNVTPGSVNADFHFVPSIHLPDTLRAAVKAYAATPGATATINQATIVHNVPAPLTAAFSSRGPLTAGGGDLLKPDVIAPGQDILAAVAPPGNGGLSYALYSGTSMSSPHVAGVAALLRDLRPEWSPMAIKSALMTSASDVLDGPNTNPLVIFRQGAGHIRPNSAADPGLIFDSNVSDWLAFLCGATTGVNPSACSSLVAAGYSLDPSDLNVASIAIGDLAGVQIVHRRITNVGLSDATYTANVIGLGGINATVFPASLTLASGETKVFSVTFTRTSAAANTYAGGQLTWSDGVHNVRVPVVVRPVALAAPAQVTGNGGPITYNVKFGYGGPFTASPRGLIPAATSDHSVGDDPTDSFDTANPPPLAEPMPPGVVAIPFSIPAGTTYTRLSLFDTHVSPASDIDLYLYQGTTLVGISAGATSNEQINLVNPTAATNYVLYVHGFAVPGTANFTLFSWILGSASAGNMTVSAPTTAVLGATSPINLTFSGLAPATKYLGSVAYSGAAGMPNPTIVRVDTP
jgi:subtilisin family serine protease